MRVQGRELLIPSMMVGNYPKPMWYQSLASTLRLPEGDLIHDSYEQELLKDALTAIVHDQEAAGLDIISDGRIQGAESFAKQALYYYHRCLTNVEPHGPNLGLPIYSKLYASTVTGPIRRKHPIMTPIAKIVRELTDKPIKIQYIGPQILAQSLHDKHYSSARDRAMDVAAAINEDVLEVDALGADYIQIDEFGFTYGVEEWGIEAFQRAVDGVKNAKILYHVCFGSWGGTPGYHPDGTAEPGKEVFALQKRPSGAALAGPRAVLPIAYQLPIDVLHVEFARKGLESVSIFNEFKPPENLDIFVGVIDTKSTITERVEDVVKQIEEAAKYIPPERLGASTDCGLALFQRYVASEKLKSLAEGARIARERFANILTRTS